MKTHKKNGHAKPMIQELDSEAFQKLPRKWKLHFKRIENLPKPIKQLSARKILELVSV